MVNHFRTLLLNLSPTPTPGPGEEYIPTTFVPLPLPQPLADVRTLLLTPTTDRDTLNVQIARLLAYVHTSSLRQYVTQFDGRTTYDPLAPADTVVNLISPPPGSFADAASKTVDERVVFRPAGDEADRAYYYVWSNLYPDPLRACALALALVARIEELRTH